MKPETDLCACGCGQQVTKRGNQWVTGHHMRAPNRGAAVLKSPLPLCECGCGARVNKPGNRWKVGHHARMPEYHDVISHPKPKGEPPLCACGCGERVTNEKRRWLKGHSSRKPEYREQRLCACGCGELAPLYHRYVGPHYARTIAREELLRRLGNVEDRRKSEETRDRLRKRWYERSLHAAPTRSEQKVLDALEERGLPFLFNEAIGYVARPDFQFPEAKIVLQIDGSQHSKPEFRAHDIQQDERLVELGWAVLRWTNHRVKTRLPKLLDELCALYQSRFSCQSELDSADEPPT